MDIDTLREFANLYETLRFQETADRLCVSQSALIKHIHKLGEELGISLFDRSTRSVRPNVFSETFSPYAEQIVPERPTFALLFPRPAASTGSRRASSPAGCSKTTSASSPLQTTRSQSTRVSPGSSTRWTGLPTRWTGLPSTCPRRTRWQRKRASPSTS